VRNASFEGGKFSFSAVHLCCYEHVWAASERSDVRRVSTGIVRITQHNELRVAILFLFSNNDFRTSVLTKLCPCSSAALEEGGWSTPSLGRFTSWKYTRFALYRGLGETRGRSKGVRKVSITLGFKSRTIQPVASR